MFREKNQLCDGYSYYHLIWIKKNMDAILMMTMTNNFDDDNIMMTMILSNYYT